jgi:hypothetical protein
MPLKYTLRDIVPNSDSGETFQSSEPSIAVNPVDPTQLVAGIFSSSAASYFTSTDGGTTWSDYSPFFECGGAFGCPVGSLGEFSANCEVAHVPSAIRRSRTLPQVAERPTPPRQQVAGGSTGRRTAAAAAPDCIARVNGRCDEKQEVARGSGNDP